MVALLPARVLPLFALLALLLDPTGLRGQDYQEQSPLVGRKEDGKRVVAYQANGSKRNPLVGFEFGIGNRSPFVQVSAIRPIFKDETTDRPAFGLFADATVKGRKVKSAVHTTAKVVAKDGYAVSKVVVQYGLWIDSIRVHFARIKGDALDPTDTYHSGAYGSAEARGAYTTLDSEGRLIVAVGGTADDVKAMGVSLTYLGKGPPKPAKPVPPQPVVVPRPAAEPRGGLSTKATPNPGPKITVPGFDPSAAPKPAPPRETEAEVKARIEKQNAEAKRQFDEFDATAKQQQEQFNKAFANMPRWDAPQADPEANREFWRKAIEIAEADPNLTDKQREEIAQFRKLLGLEPRTNWLAIGVGVGVCGLIGAGAYFYLNRKPARLPVARRVADDVPAEPLELGSDEPPHRKLPV